MKLRIYGENPKLWQWDTGRRLVVEDADGCDRVYFGRAGQDSAPVLPIRKEDNLRLVDIPNSILLSSGNFTAYLYFCDAEGTQTRYEQKFYVNRCPKPDAYVYTETEVLSYASLDNRLTTLEGEGLANAVAAYLKENPVQAGATAEEAAKIQQNASGIAALQQALSNGIKNPNALTFTGAATATYDGSEAVSVEIPEGGDGEVLTTLVDVTLSEAVASIEYDFGKAYHYLDVYMYTPQAAGNTTNNNVILLYPNGEGAYQFNVGSLSIYGSFIYNTTIKCFNKGLTYLGVADNTWHAGSKKATIFANGIQTATLIPRTSGEADTIPVGTHIIIRGREEL